MKWAHVFLAQLFALVLNNTVALAQDYVITPRGKLSDKDFYRVVSCGAPVGGKCRIKPFRWSKSDAKNITLRIVGIDEGFPARKANSLSAAITRAIGEVNNVGAAVRLSLIKTGRPDIEVRFVKGDLVDKLPKARNPRDVILANGAIAAVQYRGNRTHITRAKIMYSDEIPRRMIRATVLEEIVQGLGLPFDIHNRYYERRSMFSETDCCQPRLKGQAAKAILFHYPPAN